MSWYRNDYVTVVRSITGLTTDDVSNTLLYLYLNDGYNQVVQLERRWPFLETSTTLNTVVDQRDYAMSALGSAGWSDVASIVNPSHPHDLQYIDYGMAEEVWIGNRDVSSWPLYYSLWNDKINLWPKPNAVYPLVLRGYRKPLDWTASDTYQADLDARLQPALVNFVVSEVYRLQEDAQMSQFYRQAFAESVQNARKDIMRVPAAGPLVLSRGGKLSLPRGPRRGGLYWDMPW